MIITDKIKPYAKPIGYVIIALTFVYLIVVLATRKPQMPIEYKQALDSLNKANAALQQKQEQLDSAIDNYQTQIFDLDYKVSNIKEKTTVVKEYYHEISKETQSYNTTQVDSFLRNRFNY
jgi:cob(I)alamin adenosyltransferase